MQTYFGHAAMIYFRLVAPVSSRYICIHPHILEASHTERKLAVESSLSIENAQKSWLRAPMFDAIFGIYVLDCI